MSNNIYFNFSEYESSREYIDLCWQQFRRYKDAQEKLLYLIGSIFTVVLGATGIFGAFYGNEKIDITVWHITFFHALILVLALFYFYKKLNADMYSQIGLEGEKMLREKFPSDSNKLPYFFQLKTHYIGESGNITAGRSLSKFATVISIFLYIFLTTIPFMSTENFSSNGVTFTWKSLAPTVFFFILFFIVNLLYQREKKRIQYKITNDFKSNTNEGSEDEARTLQ